MARVDDRRVLNGIFWRLRSELRADPSDMAPRRLLQPFRALAGGRYLGATLERDLGGYDGRIQMIDSHRQNTPPTAAKSSHGPFPRQNTSMLRNGLPIS